jgi:hypothetical protein
MHVATGIVWWCALCYIEGSGSEFKIWIESQLLDRGPYALAVTCLAGTRIFQWSIEPYVEDF